MKYKLCKQLTDIISLADMAEKAWNDLSEEEKRRVTECTFSEPLVMDGD